MERGRAMAQQGVGARAGGDVRRQSRQEGREGRQVSVSGRATTAHSPPTTSPEKQRAPIPAPPPPSHAGLQNPSGEKPALPRPPLSSRSHALEWGVPSTRSQGESRAGRGASSPMRSESSSGVSSLGGKVEEGGMGGLGLREAGFIEVSPESSLQGSRAWVRGSGEDEVLEWEGGGKRRRVEGVTAGGKEVASEVDVETGRRPRGGKGGEGGRVAEAAGEAVGKEGQEVAGAGGDGLASAAGVVPRGTRREGPSGDGKGPPITSNEGEGAEEGVPDQPVKRESIHDVPGVSPVGAPGGKGPDTLPQQLDPPRHSVDQRGGRGRESEGTPGGSCNRPLQNNRGPGGESSSGVYIPPPLPPGPPPRRPSYHHPSHSPGGPPGGAPPSHTWRDGGRGAPGGGQSGGSWGPLNGMEMGEGRGVGEGGGSVQPCPPHQTASACPMGDMEMSELKEKIASRVKRILDPLYQDKKIVKAEYKEIARVSTHTLVERADKVCGHNKEPPPPPTTNLIDCSLCLEQVVACILARVKASGESGRQQASVCGPVARVGKR